jgi:hypothetical protein
MTVNNVSKGAGLVLTRVHPQGQWSQSLPENCLPLKGASGQPGPCPSLLRTSTAAVPYPQGRPDKTGL